MKRVLIVDDEIDLCTMLKAYLTKRNYDVHTAHTLKDGFSLLKSLTPDSLLLDNNLPDGMGWLAAENIQKQYPSLRITLISAYQSAKLFRDNLSEDINVIEKPISLNDVEKYL